MTPDASSPSATGGSTRTRTGFLPFMSLEGAGKAGTFGTVRSVNGVTNPDHRRTRIGRCAAPHLQCRRHASL